MARPTKAGSELASVASGGRCLKPHLEWYCTEKPGMHDTSDCRRKSAAMNNLLSQDLHCSVPHEQRARHSVVHGLGLDLEDDDMNAG